MKIRLDWYGEPVRVTWHAYTRFRERAKLEYTYRYREGWLKAIGDSFLRAEVAEWQDNRTALLDDLGLGIRYVCQQRRGWQWWIVTCLPLKTTT